jgi:hypothetical protein
MSDMLVLEFSTPQAVDLYNRVNEILNIDPATDAGGWPPGLISHEAGGEADALVVVEEWDSREAQDDFMRTRLGPAFGEAKAPQPVRATWLPGVGSWHRS